MFATSLLFFSANVMLITRIMRSTPHKPMFEDGVVVKVGSGKGAVVARLWRWLDSGRSWLERMTGLIDKDGNAN